MAQEDVGGVGGEGGADAAVAQQRVHGARLDVEEGEVGVGEEVGGGDVQGLERAAVPEERGLRGLAEEVVVVVHEGELLADVLLEGGGAGVVFRVEGGDLVGVRGGEGVDAIAQLDELEVGGVVLDVVFLAVAEVAEALGRFLAGFTVVGELVLEGEEFFAKGAVEDGAVDSGELLAGEALVGREALVCKGFAAGRHGEAGLLHLGEDVVSGFHVEPFVPKLSV